MELKFETIESGRARVALLPGYRKFFMNRSQHPHDAPLTFGRGWAAYLEPFKNLNLKELRRCRSSPFQ